VCEAPTGASPDDPILRLQYVIAAFGADLDARALVAAEPILEGGSFYGHSTQIHDAGSQSVTLKAEDAAKLTWSAIHAREKRGENQDALTLLVNALAHEQDSARHKALEEEQQRLQLDAARETENEARAPRIHAELDQDRVVLPRLLPGVTFVPRRPARGEEGGAE